MARYILFSIILLYSSNTLAYEDDILVRTNMSMLLSRSTDFDNKRIHVTGYVCRSGTDVPGVYLGKSDCNDANYSNAIKMDISKVKRKVKITSKPVIADIVGLFKDWSQLYFVDENFTWGVIEVQRINLRER